MKTHQTVTANLFFSLLDIPTAYSHFPSPYRPLSCCWAARFRQMQQHARAALIYRCPCGAARCTLHIAKWALTVSPYKPGQYIDMDTFCFAKERLLFLNSATEFILLSSKLLFLKPQFCWQRCSGQPISHHCQKRRSPIHSTHGYLPTASVWALKARTASWTRTLIQLKKKLCCGEFGENWINFPT